MAQLALPPAPLSPAPAPPADHEADRPGAGVAFLLAGLAIMSIQDVIMKVLAADYAVHQLVFAPGLVALPLLLAIVLMDGGWTRLRPKRPGWLLVRGLPGLACYTTY